MFLVSDNLLNEKLNAIVRKEIFYYTEMFYAFELMLYTGCRATESIDMSRWSKINSLTYQMQPQKGNNIRIFDEAEIPDFIKNAVENNEDPFVELNYEKLRYRAYGLLHKFIIKCKNKSSLLHLFRHNYAKRLKNEGKTDEEIKIKLGERVQYSADQYIYSIIESRYQITV